MEQDLEVKYAAVDVTRPSQHIHQRRCTSALWGCMHTVLQRCSNVIMVPVLGVAYP
jgi:hypothetical protein